MAKMTMKKLRLYILQGQERALLRSLLRLGCVEPETPGEESIPAEHGPWCPPAPAPERREDESLLEKALSILAEGAKIPKRRQKKALRAGGGQLLDEVALENNLLLAERLVVIDENIRRCETEEAALGAEIARLRPWEPLALPMDWPGTKTVQPLYGTLDISHSPEDLVRAAEEVSAAVEIERISSDGKEQCLMVLCMRSEAEAMKTALEAQGFRSFDFGSGTGTVRPGIRAREKSLRSLGERKAALQRELAAHGGSWEELRLAVARIKLLRRRDEAAERFRCNGRLLALDGWLPAERETALAACLAAFDCAWETEAAVGPETPRMSGKGLFARLFRRRRRVFTPLSLELENVKIRKEDTP